MPSPDEFAWIIGYDVVKDRRRTRLANLLDLYGQRIQYSLFQGRLRPVIFDNLLENLKRVIDCREDRLHVFPLCTCCARRRLAWGQATNSWPETPRAVIW